MIIRHGHVFGVGPGRAKAGYDLLGAGVGYASVACGAATAAKYKWSDQAVTDFVLCQWTCLNDGPAVFVTQN